MSETRSVVSSAKLIAICTLLSRITGLIREMLLAHSFGLRWVLDAFNYGFTIPNLFRRLLGEGAMAAVFVPTFTQVLEKEGRPAAWRLLARTLALLSLALVTIVIVLEAVILAIWYLAPGGDPGEQASRQLLLWLTALMLPFMLAICIVALFSAILNCLGSFVPAALAPVLLNIGMIVGIAWLGPWLRPGDKVGQATVVGWMVIISGFVQVAVLVPVLRRSGVRLGWSLHFRDPAVKRMLRLLAPVALGQGVLAVGVFLDAQVCVLLTHKAGTPETISWLGGAVRYPLEEGAWSAITVAQRLYQFPLGVLVISLGTAAMPSFARLAARKDWRAWSLEVRQSLRLAIFEGVLTGTMMFMLAAPIIRLLYQYDRFSAADTARASWVLTFFGFAMWSFCAQHIVLRGFYSFHDARTPLKISAAVLPLNLLLTLVLVWFPTVREAAFAISSTITTGFAVIISLIIFERRTQVRLLDRELGLALGKMAVAGAVCALTVYFTRPIADGLPVGQVTGRLINAFGPLTTGTAAFLAAAWVLRLPEVGLLLPKLRRRKAKAVQAAQASVDAEA